MVNHNLKIGFRILLKNKLFSFINIGGLAMGMTVAILIGLWIHDEFLYNKNFKNYDRIVQVLRKSTEANKVYVDSALPGQLGIKLRDEYPNLFEEVSMTFNRPTKELLKSGNTSLEERGYFFQPSISKILQPEMITGNQNGFADKSGILLSESLAVKFFANGSPIGKEITLNASSNLIVSGVYKDFPKNSTFGDAAFLASQELIYNAQNPYKWNNYNLKVYALLQENTTIEDASAAIKNVWTDALDLEEPIDLQLIAMKDLYLNSFFIDGFQVTSPKMKFIWLYAIVGILVLLIACINFMNLNTARYQTRMKEVGVRKALGSLRSNLVTQFLSESSLYAILALLASLALVRFTLPRFNSITNKEIIFPYASIWFWGFCGAFTILCTLVAGSYPAAFLSSFRPTKALRGNLRAGSGSIRFRQVLVVFQFVVSIILIIGTIVVYQQISFVKERPVGYNQDNLLTIIGRSGEYFEKLDVLRNELKSTGVVEEIAQASYPLTNTLGNNSGFKRNGKEIDATFNTIYATPEYGSTVQWDLIAGRDFSRERNERGSIIISESAAKLIGVDNPLGQVLEAPRDLYGQKHFAVVGVVKDMIKASPFEPARPLMVFCTTYPMEHLFIRLKPGVDYASALPKVQDTYENLLPAEGFNYKFVGNQYLTKFEPEEQIGNFATTFCVLAVLISCLGLFGLSSFVVSQRVKEIGIRKVLGASVINLWLLLSKDFSALVLIACVLALPGALYILNSWLEGYSYRVILDPWVFLLGASACLVITVLTVSFHSLRVSKANPVESLRSE